MLKTGVGHMTTKKKKKKKASVQVISELTNGIADIAEVTLTIPLSNVTKNIHTRMFIQTKLSLPELQNMKQLGQIFKANAYYYNDKYVKNVWFVKKVKISVSPTGKSMTLTLLPFNDSYESEASTLKNLTEKKNKTTSKNKKSATKTSNLKLQGDSFLQSIVKKAIGTKTDKLACAKACDSYYAAHHVYSLYYDFTSNDFKTLWNKSAHNCGDGARTLAKMFKCLGLSPKIHLASASQIGQAYGHYWVEVEIDGRTYYCDQAANSGQHKSRRLGTGSDSVWGGHPTAGSIVEEY